MDKRNKFWRRQQMARVFKARMILYAVYGHPIIHEDGSVVEHPHWFELAKGKWAKGLSIYGNSMQLLDMQRGEVQS